MAQHLFDFLSQLSFPYLFAATAIVFLLDLFIPDLVPMAEEILLGLGAMLLVQIRKKQEHPQGVGETLPPARTPLTLGEKTHTPGRLSLSAAASRFLVSPCLQTSFSVKPPSTHPHD